MSPTNGSSSDDRDRILVALHTSDRWEGPLDWATEQALLERRGLVIVHVLEPDEELWRDAQGRDMRASTLERDLHAPSAAQLLVDGARNRVLDRAPSVAVEEVLLRGSMRSALADSAAGAHLLVLGAPHHRGPWKRLVGTAGASVARRPPCPVVVVHDTHPGRVHGGVLVGVDDTGHSTTALEFAFHQASLHRWPLTVLHVAPDLPSARAADLTEARLALATAVAGTAEDHPDVHVTTVVELGAPPAQLLRAGEATNLIVVGAHHGHPLSDILQGSVVVPVVERARCPVAVVPLEAPAASEHAFGHRGTGT